MYTVNTYTFGPLTLPAQDLGTGLAVVAETPTFGNVVDARTVRFASPLPHHPSIRPDEDVLVVHPILPLYPPSSA